MLKSTTVDPEMDLSRLNNSPICFWDFGYRCACPHNNQVKASWTVHCLRLCDLSADWKDYQLQRRLPFPSVSGCWYGILSKYLSNTSVFAILTKSMQVWKIISRQIWTWMKCGRKAVGKFDYLVIEGQLRNQPSSASWSLVVQLFADDQFDAAIQRSRRATARSC